jgi:hypothetical protein
VRKSVEQLGRCEQMILIQILPGCYRGIGRHIWNPTVNVVEVVKVGSGYISNYWPPDLHMLQQILWAYEFLYDAVIPTTKMSIILFYYRIFAVRQFRKVLYFLSFLVIGWWFAILVVAATQ